MQNTEHGPVERGVFTHNNYIIKQTYTNGNITEKAQKQLLVLV